MLLEGEGEGEGIGKFWSDENHHLVVMGCVVDVVRKVQSVHSSAVSKGLTNNLLRLRSILRLNFVG